MAEAGEFVALATEELALSAAFPQELRTRELENRQAHAWFLPGRGASQAA